MRRLPGRAWPGLASGRRHAVPGEGRIAPSHVLFVSNGERMLSDGLRTYRKVSMTNMRWLWTSAALAGVGLLYVLLRGGWLLLRGRLRTGSALAAPLAGAFMLFAPLAFFLSQSFLALGDLIIASGLLALATCSCHWERTMAWCAPGCGRGRPLMRPRLRRPARGGAVDDRARYVGMLPFMLWR